MHHHTMKISIVTPSYNQARFLERTLLSIWRQEGDFDLEHMVMDGGSTDESCEILMKYEQLYHSNAFAAGCRRFRFSWQSQADHGQADALNKGFAMSTGEILGWLNSDDILVDSHALQTVCDAFRDHDTDLVVGSVRMIDEQDRIIPVPILINTLDNAAFQKRLPGMDRVSIIAQPACFFKRTVWEQLGIAHYYFSLDWNLWIEAYKAHFTFYKIDRTIAAMRQHGEAKSVIAGIHKCREVLSIFKKNHVWCLNRFYYYTYLLMLRLEQLPLLGLPLNRVMTFGKKIRNALINRYRLY
jgi:glycosyltransferase involved in cell wall biosynthesis